MQKMLMLFLCLCFSSLAIAQKIVIEHSDKTPKPSVLKEGKFKVFLVNDTDRPITLFSSHHKEYGGCETTSEKQLDGVVIMSHNKWKPMDTNARFSTRAFSTIKANGKKFIATLSIKDKKPGTYLLKYRINQDPATVDSRYAKNGAAASKASSITKMDIEGVFEYTIEALEKKPFTAKSISFEDLKKERYQTDFVEAEYNPSDIFAMKFTIKSAEEANEVFGKVAALKNIRKLNLTINSGEPIEISAGISQLALMDFSLEVTKKSIGKVSLANDFLATGDLRTVYINGLGKVDLSFLGKHTKLESLTLRNCDLPDLSWLGNFTNLKTLYLRESSLASLPEGFKNLTALASLSLIKTNISSIEHLPAAPNLSKLDARENKIASLPTDLKGLTNLKNINLSKNMLKVFPVGLTMIPTLEELNLQENQLSKLPAEFKALVALKKLNLSNNKFKTFPAVLKFSKTIGTLRLNNNQLTALPASIAKMTKLRNLYFENNKIEEIPSEMLEMRLYKIYTKGNLLSKRQTKKLKKKFKRKLKS